MNNRPKDTPKKADPAVTLTHRQLTLGSNPGAMLQQVVHRHWQYTGRLTLVPRLWQTHTPASHLKKQQLPVLKNAGSSTLESCPCVLHSVAELVFFQFYYIKSSPVKGEDARRKREESFPMLQISYQNTSLNYCLKFVRHYKARLDSQFVSVIIPQMLPKSPKINLLTAIETDQVISSVTSAWKAYPASLPHPSHQTCFQPMLFIQSPLSSLVFPFSKMTHSISL